MKNIFIGLVLFVASLQGVCGGTGIFDVDGDELPNIGMEALMAGVLALMQGGDLAEVAEDVLEIAEAELDAEGAAMEDEGDQ